ncbi:matrixin family metalloprotease [Paenilisteria rocourtiae]|uniref:Matrixin n=1 Tax=Listeria rocourtiae TaxID=647910 RepID=A0A4R6ZK32_9LIST|nr:matrixin family metalloprotease [Listeria rocourtiae]EUJ52170.1 hypothetical protein PROCOU_00595 [Listeria rocourtiae FSL F6-920]MBC1433827.1 matrixin family metalloprotease [Listeria rocourtiae]MBC1605032.1 matrixin family metalloprotease [Listeria rocourtiae]TDR52424.1 matrixin [Listeria rocourtiae]
MKKKYLSLIIGLAMLFILAYPSNAMAYTKLGYYMKIAEAKNFKTFINPSAKAYSAIILNGAKSWNASPYLNTLSTGQNASPHFTVSSSKQDKGSVVASCSTWTYGTTSVVAKNEVTTFKGFVALNVNNKTETIAHEYGHGFGLGHVKAKNAIMLDIGFTGKIKPQADDLNGIKAIYQGIK